MLRVTADTNIYVSALNFGGPPPRLVDLARAGTIRLVISDAISAEISDVLSRAKFGWPARQIEGALAGIASFTECVQPTRTLDIITADPSDNRVLECADAGQVDYIVSGDKHLLRLRQHGNAPILKVADFLRRLQEPQEHSAQD